MKVFVPDALRAYTNQARCVDADGATLQQLVLDLDQQFPGIAFRMINEQDAIRPNIVFFVSGAKVHDLSVPLSADDEVFIMQALAGG